MLRKNKIIQFGENVEGYTIPVLNEREIRAAAGILFVFLFIALVLILFKENFLMIKYVIILFLTDLIIRVFINPKFSPLLIIGRLIVSGQVPEYVGAPQKKFAWKIGIALAGLMFILLIVVNSTSIFTGLSCLICLLFLFFESAFGICLGCSFYGFFYKDKAQYCAGETCDVTKKHTIQKISWAQVLIIFGFILYTVLTIFFFNARFSEVPRNLWEIIN